MELYKEILVKLLEKQEIKVTFPNLRLGANQLVEMHSYRALERIKMILQNDDLSDPECFAQIEEIILIFEQLGSSGGHRHDF